MRVTVTNLTLNLLSTDVGLLNPGETRSLDMGPEAAYRAAEGLKLLGSKVSVSVLEETRLLDALEPASLGTPVALADNSVTTTKLAALAVTDAKLAAQSVTADKTKMSVSAEQTGTGASQNVAHSLGATPTRVLVALTGGPAAYSQPTIAEGAHDATNVVVTVTTGWKYKVEAWA